MTCWDTTMPNDKTCPAGEEPELAAVCGCIEHAYLGWATRVLADTLTRGVPELCIRWGQAGHNAPQASEVLRQRSFVLWFGPF